MEVFEVKDGALVGPPFLLAKNGDAAAAAFADDRDCVQQSDFPTQGRMVGEVVAVMRVYCVENSEISIEGLAGQIDEVNQWGNFDVVTRPPVIDKPALAFDPYERFAPLSPNVVKALIGETFGGGPMRNSAKNLQALIDRRWPQGTDPQDDPEEVVLQQARVFADLAPRFLEHGPTQADSAPAFSLATVARPDPWRLEPDAFGMLETVFVHKDNRARLRRYLVRPFARYDALVESWHGAQETDPDRAVPWVARRSLADSFSQPGARKYDLPRIHEDEIAAYSVDIGVPRTEKLAPPLVLSAKRLDRGEGAGGLSGGVLEFVVARHGEEILSESNIPTADSLQFEHVAYGFRREYAHRAWAEGLISSIDLTAPFGNGSVAAAPVPTLIEGGHSIQDTTGHASLADRIPDGWGGVTVLRTREVPHFFRLHLVSFAAAGVVVSEPVVATIPEGHASMSWPWTPGLIGEIDATPTWKVVRQDAHDGSYTLTLQVSLPLIRHVDGMPQADREAWNLGSIMPDVFTLPEPLVSYEIATARVSGADASDYLSLADWSPEVELLPEVPQPKKPPKYRVKRVGPRFAGGTKNESDIKSFGKAAWRTEIESPVAPPEPVMVHFDDSFDEPLRLFANELEEARLPRALAASPAPDLPDLLAVIQPVNLVAFEDQLSDSLKVRLDDAIAALETTIAETRTHRHLLKAVVTQLFAHHATGHIEVGSSTLLLPFTITTTKHVIKAKLDAFQSAPGSAVFCDWSPKLTSVLIDRPLTGAELRRLSGLCATLANDNPSQKSNFICIERRIRAATKAQVLGRGRQLMVRAARGHVAPILAPIEWSVT